MFAYFVCLFFVGIPFYFLELLIGQHSRRSCIACWDVFAPICKGKNTIKLITSISNFQYSNFWKNFEKNCWRGNFLAGLGYGMVIISSTFVLYYHAILSWILYYMAVSFSWVLPWTTCNATWNTPNCVLTLVNDSFHSTELLLSNVEDTNLPLPGNGSSLQSTIIPDYKPMSAAEEFWQWVNIYFLICLRQLTHVINTSLPRRLWRQ